MAESLESRFTEFLKSLPGSESIDALTLPVDPRHRRKADFLLADRKIIVELKTLTTDTSPKIELAVEKHRHREEFPLFYGTTDLQRVLAHLPDGDAINRNIYMSITRSVEDNVRSAEEQISHTRQVLDLPNAIGLLVILNETVQVLDPTLVGHRVANLMRRTRTGNSSSATLDFTWLLFESHSLGSNSRLPTFPSMLICGERAASFPEFVAFHNNVQRRWAAFNGAAFVDGGSTSPNSLEYTATAELLKPRPHVLPRHELWRSQYRVNPYLRQLTDASVLELGRAILQRLTPHFLKGGPDFAAEVVTPLLEEFAHFQEEASHRCLDWRSIPKP
jgi:hypothetical protein